MKNDAVLRELEAVPVVRKAKKITITEELRKRFGPHLARIKANHRNMTAYQFTYTSRVMRLSVILLCRRSALLAHQL